EPRDAIAEHRSGPSVAVFIDGNVIRIRPRRRHGPLLEFFAIGVEHADLVAAVLAEPKPVLRIHHAAAWPRTFGGRLIHRELPGPRIDPADVLLTDVGAIRIVLGVGDDSVDVVSSRRILKRVPRLRFAGLEVYAVHARAGA